MTKSAVTPKPENRIVRYLKDTRAEIAKVTWPTREEGLRLSAIVFVVTIIATIVLFGVDSLFGFIIGLLIRGTAG
ncbi:preprotein translocase subunit SecE [Caldilinea sp.]|jgi:preprotein translocase subunit SecE|uniref:preprotein translocase subunit SecE n=1 Tax=Caldilinea sp. TaxID=2293560 RepID=UPI0021DDBA32|nr:preprotein translocase subunit SecE [Caldilinea sp.]GIV69917.1 MAG: protein translocase subunit SecE [Caldilinea sp.]